MNVSRVVLKAGKEKPLRAFHPWVFSGAIDRAEEAVTPGDLVRVESNGGEFFGIGYINPKSQIAIRMLTFRDEVIDAGFFIRRLQEAKKLRDQFMPPATNAIRLVHSEGDFLSGLILDRYADYLVAQFLTAGMEALKPLILEAVERIFQPKGIYERFESEARRKEGLETRGEDRSANFPDEVVIEEHGNKFKVDIKRGQKTGFFLDQRENRKLVGDHAKGQKVLNCFAYSGGFSVYAAKGGARSITSVETQERASRMIQHNFDLNELGGVPHVLVEEDVFNFLRRDTTQYDVGILDPPAFCRHKSQLFQASRGYKDINLFMMKRLAAGGLLFTSSCSSFISPDLFQKIVFGAARDAGREVQVVRKTSQPFDHPVNIYHPEGEYLKGLFLRVL